LVLLRVEGDIDENGGIVLFVLCLSVTSLLLLSGARVCVLALYFLVFEHDVSHINFFCFIFAVSLRFGEYRLIY